MYIIRAQSVVFQDIDGDLFTIIGTVRPQNGAPAVSEDVSEVLTLVNADSGCRPNKHLFHLQFIGCFCRAPTSLSSNCRKLPAFVGCFEIAVSPDGLLEAMKEIKDAIAETKKLVDAVNNMKRGTTIHRAFQLRPAKNQLWSWLLIEPVSDWALSEMMADLHKRSKTTAYQFYCSIQGSSNASALVERMFETQFHLFVADTPRTFTIESLDDRSDTLQVCFSSNTNHNMFGDINHFSGWLSSSNTSLLYLQPLSPVFPSFDAFLHQPTRSFAWFLASHCFAGDYYTDPSYQHQRLRESSTIASPGTAERSPPDEKWKDIVPKTLGAAFLKQRIEGTEKVEHWYGKTGVIILLFPQTMSDTVSHNKEATAQACIGAEHLASA